MELQKNKDGERRWEKLFHTNLCRESIVNESMMMVKAM